MSTPRWRQPSPALVVSSLALFIALAGTGIALPGKNKIDHNDLQRHVVHTGKIHNGAVRGSKLARIIETKESFTMASEGIDAASSSCPAGTRVIGGGFDTGEEPPVEVVASGRVAVLRSRRDGNGWEVWFANHSGATINATVLAYCLK